MTTETKAVERMADMRHYLNEAHQFAAMSPRGRDCIGIVLDMLDEMESEAAIPSPEGAPQTALPNLMPVIAWLENGCDPMEAAKELRIYQAQAAAPAPQAAPCVVDGVLYSRSVVKRLAVQMGLVQEAPVALTRQQVKALMQEAGYDQAGPSARADFISGVRHAEQAHGIPAPKEPTNGR